MTPRERFLALLNYEQLDAPLLMQWMGFGQELLPRWRQQGLPAEADPFAHFGLTQPRHVPVSLYAYPPRPEVELSHEGSQRIILDNRDLRWLHDANAPYFAKCIGHPVQTREDWTRYYARLNVGCEERYDALRQAAPSLRSSEEPVLLSLRGCWEIRYFMGMTEALVALHDDPGFIEEMLAAWFDHLWHVIDRVCEYVVPDAACVWEDLAYKNGPFLSPAMYLRYFAPYHAETARRLQARGVRHFLVDCDGDIDTLLPLFLDHGLTGTYPLECQAGADPRKFRRQYGKRVQLVGGIDKRALIAGQEATRTEVEQKLTALVADSGYLPSLDHAVPAEVELDTFRYYADCLRETWERLL